MSISSTTNRIEYTGNGAVDTYAYTFRILDDDDLLVTVTNTATPPVETTLTKTTDYTVTGVGSSGGGNVVLVNASQAWLDADGDLKSNYILVIRRVRPLTQETDIRNQGSFYPETHEDVFDHLVMIAQQHQDEIDRSIKLPESVTDSDFDPTLPPDLTDAVSKVPMINEDGDGFADVDDWPSGAAIAAASTNATAAAASATAAAASAAAALASEEASEDLNAFIVTGATADGVANDTTAIQTAIDAASAAGGGTVFFPPGTYACVSVQLKSNVSLAGKGATLLKRSGATPTAILEGTGTVGSFTALTANATEGLKAVAVTSASGLAVGDYVLIRDATYAYSSTGRNQEVNKIFAISGLNITLCNAMVGSYATASTAQLAKLTPIDNVSIRDLTLRCPTTVGEDIGGCLFVTYGTKIRIDRCEMVGFGSQAGTRFDTSYDISITNSVYRDGQYATSVSYGFGFSFNEGTHHALVNACRFYNVNESLITNNSSHVIVSNNLFLGSSDSAVNTHGSGNHDVLICGNHIIGGSIGIAVGHASASASDYRVQIVGNYIRDCGSHGISVNNQTGSHNNRVTVLANYIINFGVSTASSFGILVNYSDKCVVNNNYVEGVGATNPITGIYILNSDDAVVQTNTVKTISNGYGIRVTDSTSVYVAENSLSGISSYNVYATGTVTLIVKNNNADDATVSLAVGGITTFHNSWDSYTGSGKTVLDTSPTLGTVTLSNSISPLTLAGDPTNGMQIVLCNTASQVNSAVGCMRSSGNLFLAFNSQHVSQADNWQQNAAGSKSVLIDFGTSGISFYQANAGTANGNKATFWGTALVTITTAGVLTATGQLIGKGTATNDNAAAGYIGQYTESVESTGAAITGATGVWGDVLSISFTAGDWDVTGGISIDANGATVSSMQFGISSTAGDFSTGLVEGSNHIITVSATASNNRGGVIPSYRMSLSATTTVYLKAKLSYVTATPNFKGRISARRMR